MTRTHPSSPPPPRNSSERPAASESSSLRRLRAVTARRSLVRRCSRSLSLSSTCHNYTCNAIRQDVSNRLFEQSDSWVVEEGTRRRGGRFGYVKEAWWNRADGLQDARLSHRTNTQAAYLGGKLSCGRPSPSCSGLAASVPLLSLDGHDHWTMAGAIVSPCHRLCRGCLVDCQDKHGLYSYSRLYGLSNRDLGPSLTIRHAKLSLRICRQRYTRVGLATNECHKIWNVKGASSRSRAHRGLAFNYPGFPETPRKVVNSSIPLSSRHLRGR